MPRAELEAKYADAASRFVDIDRTARAPWTRAARAIDGAIHRAASVLTPSATVDSMAFYAKVGA
jgi:hypothetical protein